MEGSPHPGRMEVRRTHQNHVEWGGSEDVQDAICQSEMEAGINKQRVKIWRSRTLVDAQYTHLSVIELEMEMGMLGTFQSGSVTEQRG